MSTDLCGQTFLIPLYCLLGKHRASHDECFSSSFHTPNYVLASHFMKRRRSIPVCTGCLVKTAYFKGKEKKNSCWRAEHPVVYCLCKRDHDAFVFCCLHLLWSIPYVDFCHVLHIVLYIRNAYCIFYMCSTFIIYFVHSGKIVAKGKKKISQQFLQVVCQIKQVNRCAGYLWCLFNNSCLLKGIF